MVTQLLASSHGESRGLSPCYHCKRGSTTGTRFEVLLAEGPPECRVIQLLCYRSGCHRTAHRVIDFSTPGALHLFTKPARDTGCSAESGVERPATTSKALAALDRSGARCAPHSVAVSSRGVAARAGRGTSGPSRLASPGRDRPPLALLIRQDSVDRPAETGSPISAYLNTAFRTGAPAGGLTVARLSDTQRCPWRGGFISTTRDPS